MSDKTSDKYRITMSDTISRQAAMDTIMGQPPEPHYPSWYAAQIEKLPSAQPERKKGKWDFMGWQMFQCSECKHTFTQDFLEGWRGYTYEPFFPPFCPNCGAKMDEKEKTNETD